MHNDELPPPSPALNPSRQNDADARFLAIHVAGESPLARAIYHAMQAEKTTTKREILAQIRACADAAKETRTLFDCDAAANIARDVGKRGRLLAEVATAGDELELTQSVVDYAERTASECDLRATVERCTEPRLREALRIVTRFAFENNDQDRERTEPIWPVFSDGESGYELCISIRSF